MLNDLNDLFKCPILNTKMDNPMILPSGNTVDKDTISQIKDDRDPYNKNLKTSNAIPNRLAKQIKEILDGAKQNLDLYNKAQPETQPTFIQKDELKTIQNAD